MKDFFKFLPFLRSYLLFKGLESFENSTQILFTAENFAFNLLRGKEGLSLSAKGFLKSPYLSEGKKFFSCNGLFHLLERGAIFSHFRVYLEGYGEVGGLLLVERVNLQALAKTLKGEKEATKLLLTSVPRYITFTISLEEEALKELRKEAKDLEKELKPLLEEKGVLGDLARALYQILEGKAQGIKVEIENLRGLDIAQLVGLFIVLSATDNGKQIEQLLNNYLKVKVLAF